MDLLLRPGAQVRLEGLKSRPELNGATGSVLHFLGGGTASFRCPIDFCFCFMFSKPHALTTRDRSEIT